MRADRWKMFHAGAWITIGITAVWFLVVSPSFPRPFHLFTVVSFASVTILASILVNGTESRTQITSVITFTVISGVVLRRSGSAQLALGSGDQRQLFTQAISIVEHGEITFGGHYAAAPIYTIQLSINSILTGLGKYNMSLIIMFISVSIPLLIALITYYVTLSAEGSLIVAILSNQYALFTRGSVVAEAEGVAIVWFLLSIILLMNLLYRRDNRFRVLLIFLASTSIFVHILYGSIIATVVATTVVLYRIIVLLTSYLFKLNAKIVKNQALMIVPLLIGLIILSRMLWSGQAGRSVWLFSSLFELPDVNSWYQLLIPQTGAASRGVGSAGTTDTSTTWLEDILPNHSLILALFHVSIVGISAVVGAIYSLWEDTYRYLPFYLLSGVLFTITLVVVAFQFSYNLSFRFYYFASIALFVFSGTLLSQISRQQLNIILVILLVLFSFLLIGPTVPLGNDWDPRFGGTSFAITHTEKSQMDTFSIYKPDETKVVYEVRNRNRDPVCKKITDHRVWDTNTYTGCSPSYLSNSTFALV